MSIGKYKHTTNTNNIIDIKNYTEKNSCSNAPASGCKQCNKNGIPIFPVRYTVCSIAGHEAIPTLPDDLINSVTSIQLDKILSTQDKEQNISPLNRYILRKLRKGYLYIYDELYGGQWQCMGVMPGGELLPFPPSTPIPPEKLIEFICQKNEVNEHIASLVTIPFSTTSRKIYTAFVEYPWSIEQIKLMTKDKTARSRCMQEFTIEKHDKECINKNQGLLRPIYEVEQYLPEYNSYISFISSHDLAFSTESLNNIYEDELKRAVDKVNSSPHHHKGLMMIINDEIAIIEQLKEYRHSLQNNLEKNILERNGEQGVREYYWLKTVNILEESLKQQFDNNAKRIKYKIDNTFTKKEMDRYNKDQELLARHNENSIGNGFATSLGNQTSNQIRDLYNEIDKTNTQKEETIKELCRYYSQSKRKELNDYFKPIIEEINEKNNKIDANYCKWVKFGLLPALDRHDQVNIEHSMYAVSIIASALDDGSILSNDSRELWIWLHNHSQKDSDSILSRGILLNHKETRRAYGELLEQNNEGVNQINDVPIAPLNTLKLKQWYDLIKKGQKLSEKHNDIKIKELSWKAGWKDFKKPYDQLRNASATSRVALWNKHYSEAMSLVLTGKKLEGELVHSIQQLQISGMVEAALQGKPMESYMLEARKCCVQSSTLYKIIEINSSIISNTTPLALKPIYNSGSFKTGDKNYTHTSGGNFIVNNPYPSEYIEIWTSQMNKPLEKSREAIIAEGIANDLTKRDMQKYEEELLSDQKKIAESWNNEKKFVISANILMAGYSMMTAFEELKKHPDSLEKWWKAAGTFIGFTQSVCDFLSNSLASYSETAGGLSYRMTKIITPLNQTQIAKISALNKAGSNLLSKTLAIIGIIDGIISIIKAYDKYYHGGLTTDFYVEAGLGTLSIIGSIITIALGSAVLIPVTITLIVLSIGSVFFLAHLVPQNIEVWLRRSLFGKEQKNVIGGIFRNLEEEQSSLQMVLRGITVDIELKNEIVYYAKTAPSLGSSSSDDDYVLKINMSFSDTPPSVIIIEIRDSQTNSLQTLLKAYNQELEFYELPQKNIFFQQDTLAKKIDSTKIEKQNVIYSNISYRLGKYASNEYKITIDVDNNLAKDTYHVKKR